ncbi:MAG: 3-dehydroquinate synthase [Bacteroidales bacterium]
METILVKGKTSESTIIVGENIANLSKYILGKGVFIITDENVDKLYSNNFPDFPKYVVKAGEASKNLLSVSEIYRWLLDVGADRSSFIVGIGGGVVCDIAGFVASTYMRGIEFGFVATSLLAQVDASVGGKNGVDLDGYKNIVGTFNQPRFVICDTLMLKTLPSVELSNGLAEMVKHTLIADAADFAFMEENIERLMGCDVEVITSLLAKSVRIKASIVSADEQEKGERKKLNLGHTWGHAVEKISGLPHGQSVSIGLEFAARLSTEKGLLQNRDYMRLMNLLRELHLPICTNINPSRIFDALTKDKKKVADSIDFILMKGIGEVIIERIGLVDIQNFIKR